MYAAAPTGAQVIGAAAVAALTVVGTTPVTALDINAEPGLLTETVGTRDRLKYYDSSKIYGAASVSEKPRVFLMPDGVRLGSFLTFPSVTETGIYDTNIFGSAKNPEADWRSELKAAVSSQSQFSRHQLLFNVDGTLVNYLENTDQDHVDGGAHIRGSFDIDHANAVAASVHTELKHEDRSASTASRDAAEPVPVWTNTISAGITHDVGKLYGTISATAQTSDYFSVKAFDGSKLNQDYRDQTLYSGTLRAGYRFSPGFEAIGKLRTLRATNEGDAITDRDSYGYEATTGLSFETNPVLKWALVGGYGIRDYDRNDLDTFATYLVEGQVEWQPTQRLTLYGTARRTIDDALGAEDGGRVSTAIELRAEYELYHDLVGAITASAIEGEYIGLDRTDYNYSAGTELNYFYTKNMLLTLGYEYGSRNSSQDDFDLTRHQVRLGGKLRF
jgi:hypothetical protein